MRLKLSLSQKALLLVIIPLSAELIFIATLGVLLKQLESDARRLERSRAMMGSATNVAKLTFDASRNLIAYNLSKSHFAIKSYDTSLKQIPEELEFLEKVAEGDPQDMAEAEQLRKLALHGMQLFKETKDRAEKQEQGLPLDLLAGGGLASDIQETMGELSMAVDTIARRHKKIEHRSPEAEARSRSMVELALIAGIILNLVLALALTIFFNRSTAQRLKLLMDNTQRLARAEELRPPVGGYDEISELDRTFREMAKALAESNRIKREFLEMVSHDVRTPLASVMILLDMLESGSKPETMASKLTAGKKNLEQVITLLNELLDIHRMESGKLELSLVETGAAEILEEAIETVAASAQKAGISIGASDNPVSISCDPDRMRQVFINLLSNALKFAPPGSRIQTEIQVHDEFIKIMIRDQGPGVPAEYKERIFDRFQQIRASDEKKKGGRRLGLAICKSIVEQHGGKIGVDDAAGGGSEFWVLLPKLKP
ncbi:MAG: HAMP domain-containing histidine kinase [Candidatus Obscuribacterales bacterium]|nr:HAMP domain-containing histidine kinase [Candidatus Obscuribacterales bacterium]